MIAPRLHVAGHRQTLARLLAAPTGAWGAHVGSQLWHCCRNIDAALPALQASSTQYTAASHAEAAALASELSALQTERNALGTMPVQQPFSAAG